MCVRCACNPAYTKVIADHIRAKEKELIETYIGKVYF